MSSNDTPVSSCSRLQAESIALTVLNADMPGWLTSRGCFLCQHGNIEAGRSRRCHIRQSQHHRRIINPAVYITTPLSSRVTLPPFFAVVSFFFFFFFFFQKPTGTDDYAPTNDVMTLKMTLPVIPFHFDSQSWGNDSNFRKMIPERFLFFVRLISWRKFFELRKHSFFAILLKKQRD